jgi:aryl carrier-like protein
VSGLFDAIEGSRLPAVAGIFHFAGVTRIRSLEQVSHDDFVEVMAAKVWGGWLLDREVRARGIELSLFVCASSTASAWGAPHQADYAAANAYLDALMARRQAEGLPACAIQFGPWRGAGMTVDQDALDQLERMGFRLFRPSVALDAMEAIAVSGAAQMAAVDVDWSTLKPLLEVQKSWPLLESVGEAQRGDAAANSDVAHSEELDRLKTASRRERAQILAMTIRTEAARVLGVGPESIADDASLLELGLDSLMAVDLISRLRQRLKTIRFSPQLVYDHPTVAALATALADQIASGETGCADTESLPGDGTNPRPSPPSTAHRPIGLESVQYRVNDGPVYTYRRYREQDRAGAILSFANPFGQKMANVLDSVFEWKYLKSPLTPDRGSVLHVLECEAKVVGFSGTVPARFKIEDDTMPGVWSTDTHVAPSHRTVTGGSFTRSTRIRPASSSESECRHVPDRRHRSGDRPDRYSPACPTWEAC